MKNKNLWLALIINCLKECVDVPLNSYSLTSIQLVHSLVTSRLDYSNALLCGARDDVINQLECVQRIAARVVCKKCTNDHSSVMELLWGLHWLPIKARIQYKILLLVYKALNTGVANLTYFLSSVPPGMLDLGYIEPSFNIPPPVLNSPWVYWIIYIIYITQVGIIKGEQGA